MGTSSVESGTNSEPRAAAPSVTSDPAFDELDAGDAPIAATGGLLVLAGAIEVRLARGGLLTRADNAAPGAVDGRCGALLGRSAAAVLESGALLGRGAVGAIDGRCELVRAVPAVDVPACGVFVVDGGVLVRGVLVADGGVLVRGVLVADGGALARNAGPAGAVEVRCEWLAVDDELGIGVEVGAVAADEGRGGAKLERSALGRVSVEPADEGRGGIDGR